MKHWKIYALTLSLVVSGWSAAALGAELGGLQPRANVFSQAADDDGGLCICEKVNGSWVCRPVGCMGTFSEPSKLDGLQQRPIDRRVLPVDPTRTAVQDRALIRSDSRQF